MRVQDVMTTDVETMPPGAAAEDAWELMRRREFHHIVVTNGSRTVLGILSDRYWSFLALAAAAPVR